VRSADVVIVGGGIIGCLTAYYLTLRGVRPVIVEADGIASGASGASAGWLTPYSASCDPRVLALSPASLKLHRKLAEELPAETGIDHRFQQITYVRCAFTEDGVRHLREWQRVRIEEGASMPWLSPEDARRAVPYLTGEILGAVSSDSEPTVDSYRLTVSAAQAAEKRGAKVVSGRVVGLVTAAGRAGSGSRSAGSGATTSVRAATEVRTATGVRLADGSEISSGKTVLSMGPWTGSAGDWLGYPVPVRPRKGQMLHLERPGPGEGRDFDIGMSAHDLGGSILPKRDGNTILGATREDVGFDRSLTTQARDLLLSQAQRLSTRVLSARLARQTACLRPYTPDMRAFVGAAPRWNGVYLAAGHYSEGIHYGPVSANALAGLIVDGKPGHDLSAYDPGRLVGPNPPRFTD
jgi:glycine oxidase